MNRNVAMIVVVVALGWASLAQAQVYTVYYPAPAVVSAPVPVTTYYAAPRTVYYAPAPAPRVAYYAPPTVTYYRPGIVGAVTGWRYRTPVTYSYPVTTAYYPAYW